MMMDTMEPTDTGQPQRPSSLEDVEVPTPTPSRVRPPLLTTAAIVLMVAGVMNALYFALFQPTGATAVIVVLVAIAQVMAATLVLLRHQAGFLAGLGMGGIGVVLGIARIPADAASGLITMALSIYVIWAVASNRPAFGPR
jgi:hypothetical protein